MSNVPDFKLTMGGTDLRGSIFEALASFLDITAKVRPRLISLSLSEKRGEEADQLDLTLDDADGQLAIPPAGARLHLQIGWLRGPEVTVGLVDKGVFIVDEVSHEGPPDAVVIRARAADFAGEIATRREVSYHDTTLGKIVEQVAGRNQLKPVCAPALAAIVVKSKAQSRESDLAFLRRIGREHDAVASIKAGRLILSPIGAGVTPSGKALPTLTVRRRDGDRHSFRIEKRDSAEGVTANWHDRGAGKQKSVTVGKADGAKKLRKTFANENDARTAAAAEGKRLGRSTLSLELTLALGRGDVFPEQRVKVVGFKPQINDAEWLLSEVTHNLGDRGFSTSLKLEGVGGV